MSRHTLPRARAEAIASAFLARRRLMHGGATMTAPAGTGAGAPADGGSGQGAPGAGGGGPSGSDGGSGSGPDGSRSGSNGGGQPPGDQGPRFTQADLDRIVGERVAAERAKAEQAIAEAKATAGKSEAEKLQIERDQAREREQQTQAKAAERIAKTEAKVAAIAAGANPERVAAIVRNADLSGAVKDGEVDDKAIAAAIGKVLEDFPEWKAGAGRPGASASGGELNGGGGGDKPTFTRDQLAKMTPQEVAARADEINAAIAEGRVTG